MDIDNSKETTRKYIYSVAAADMSYKHDDMVSYMTNVESLYVMASPKKVILDVTSHGISSIVEEATKTYPFAERSNISLAQVKNHKYKVQFFVTENKIDIVSVDADLGQIDNDRELTKELKKDSYMAVQIVQSREELLSSLSCALVNEKENIPGKAVLDFDSKEITCSIE